MEAETDFEVSIPAALLLNIMRDENQLHMLLDVPDFRSWMLNCPRLVASMLKDRIVKQHIENHEDENLWKHCVDAMLCQKEPPISLDGSTYCSLNSCSPLSSPAVDIKTTSTQGDATTKLGQGCFSKETGMSIATETNDGDAMTNIGSLSIQREGQAGVPNSKTVTTISAKSDKGNATSSVDTLVLGNSNTRLDGGYAKVKKGVAIVGQNRIGQGIFFNSGPEFDASPFLKPRRAKGEENVKPFRSPSSSDSNEKLNYESELAEARDEVKACRKMAEEASIIAAAASRKGNATLLSKKMDVEIQDSTQHVMAYAQSEEKDAKLQVDEISFRITKPEQKYKTFNIDKVVGSLYVDSTMTSSFANCEGSMNGIETAVNKASETKKKQSKSKTSK